jgi:hypothetical protein
MPDDLGQPIVCASYTHARRHPMVLGTIGDWSLPFQVTITQIGVFLVGLVAVNQTWRFWAPLLPPVVAASRAWGCRCWWGGWPGGRGSRAAARRGPRGAGSSCGRRRLRVSSAAARPGSAA